MQEMIRDRQSQIKAVQSKIELQTTKVDRVRESLEKVREGYSKEHVDHTLQLEKLQEDYSKAVKDLKAGLENLDMKKQHTAAQLHLYNEIMKAIVVPVEGDSSYVLRMQAQLCKAMHSMGMLDAQLAMIETVSTDRQKYLKEVVTRTTEEKSHVELQLMNGLIMGGDALREVEEKHRAMVDEFTADKDALLEKIERQQDKDDDDDEEEEEDDEEEKAELQEILDQGREELERLEKENKEELNTLEELKSKVASIRGEPFVDELVATLAEEYKQEEEEDEEEED